jgi:outer membrane protein assembly factor BamB
MTAHHAHYRATPGGVIVGAAMAAAVCGFCAGPALAQAEFPEAPDPPPRIVEAPDLPPDIAGAPGDSDRPRDESPSRLDVYLDDSLEAADEIARARGLASRGDWHGAAEVLQRVSDTLGSKLIRVGPELFVGIRAHVNDLLCDWPAAGQAAYRAMFDAELTARLESDPANRDLSRLLPLFEQYFCTTGAADLADTIGQIALEAGDFALAERVYSAVVERHPERARYAAPYGAMRDVLGLLQGRSDVVRSEAHVKLRWMGQDLSVGEVADRIGAESWKGGPPATDDWPMFGGDASRNRKIDRDIDELALIWRFETGGGDDRGGRDFAGGGDGPQPFMNAVVSEGLVIAQSGRELYAVDRDRGELVWQFRPDEGEPGEQIAADDTPWGWSAPTIHNGWVFAALPGRVTPYFGFEGPSDSTELVSVDAATGGERWRITRESLGPEGDDISFDPAMLARNDSLYVVGRRRRAFGFEDCYLYCFAASDRRLKFRTHLGSASTGTFAARQATMAIPAMDGDDVYVGTNLGTIADVSAHTGAIRWLRRYARGRIELDRRRGRSLRDVPPWQHNPVVLDADRVICLPIDALELIILDARSGAVLRTHPIEELGGAVSLIGADDGAVYTVGQSVTRFDPSEGTVRWSRALLGESPLRGRATRAGSNLLVPTAMGLTVCAMADGGVSTLAWRRDGGSGNVVAMPDAILVAEVGSISAYQRRSAIWARLKKAMDASPDDPMPALELARVALSGGHADEAMGALREAVRRGGDFRVPIEPRIKSALFETVDGFVTTLSGTDGLTPERLDVLFDYASQCAPDEASHLAYRLRFAPLFESRGLPDRSIHLYQQILRDRTLRMFSTSDERTAGESPGALAEARIAALIEKHGAPIYAPFEQEAQQWLADAEASGDAQRLDRLLATFPNSQAARRALIVQADLLSGAGDHEAAARRLVLAFHRRAVRSEGPALIKRIADAYEQAGKLKHAYRWLTKAARDFPGALVEHQDARLTFLDYRKRLDGVRAMVEPSRPNVELPLGDEVVRAFPDGVALLSPRFDRDPRTSWRRAYLYVDGAIRAMDPTLTTPLWPAPAPVRISPDLLFATDELAVLATTFEVFALSARTGERLWTRGEYPATLGDADADWEDSPALRWFALTDDRLLTVRDDGVFSLISVADGALVWVQPQRIAPAGTVGLGDAWVVYHTLEADGKRAAVCLLSAEDGTWQGLIQTEEERTVQDVFITLDGQVIMSTTESISAYDLDSRELRWKTDSAGRIRPDSVAIDLDAIYYSDDGHTVTCISLEDGRDVRWRSEPMTTGRRRGMGLDLVDGHVIATTRTSVFAVDGRSGATLWNGTTPTRARFVRRFISRAYVAAIHLPADEHDEPGAVFFYDHRNASGVVPRDGGVRALGPINEDRADAILLLDGALLIQVGSSIHVWHH